MHDLGTRTAAALAGAALLLALGCGNPPSSGEGSPTPPPGAASPPPGGPGAGSPPPGAASPPPVGAATPAAGLTPAPGATVAAATNPEAIKFVEQTYGPSGKAEPLRFKDASSGEVLTLKVAEVGKQTSTTPDGTTRVYVLFEEKGSEADLFLSGSDGSFKVEKVTLRRNTLEQAFKAGADGTFEATGELKQLGSGGPSPGEAGGVPGGAAPGGAAPGGAAPGGAAPGGAAPGGAAPGGAAPGGAAPGGATPAGASPGAP